MSKAEKHGFIYLWYDRRRRQFYIGSHWGTEDDGYICSSTWMRNSYKRRREDFKRRIIARVDVRANLMQEEQRWLDMIKKKELGVRYYNVMKNVTNVDPCNLKWTEERRQKWSGEGNPMSGKTGEQHHLFGSHRTEEQNRKQAEVMKGREPPNKGVPHTAEANEKNRQAHLGKKLSDDARQAFIEAGRKAMETVTPEQKQEWYDAASKRFKGVPLSDDHKQKLSEAKQRQFADRPLPTGVYFDKRRPNAPKPYEARATIDGKRKTIGMFATPEEAVKAIHVRKTDHK